MVQVIQAPPRRKTTAEILGESIRSGLEEGSAQGVKAFNDKKLATHKADLDLRNKLLTQSEERSVIDYGQFANILDEMEGLSKEWGIGQFSSSPFMTGLFSQTSGAMERRGRFQALQVGLYPVLKSIFPRGMTEKEFLKTAKDWIPQPGDSESTIRGKINGLRGLIPQNKMGNIPPETVGKKVKFNPKNKEHIAKRDQLMKTYNDEDKVQKLLEREFE